KIFIPIKKFGHKIFQPLANFPESLSKKQVKPKGKLCPVFCLVILRYVTVRSAIAKIENSTYQTT
ncbi:hypothetical protein ACIKK6_31475, partial [Bacillus thuringiensis]|uniref:hypothetical protein n=1 Tax=Bacillus thuringiensis TaxID=1428 RepID=UPI0037CE16DA